MQTTSQNIKPRVLLLITLLLVVSLIAPLAHSTSSAIQVIVQGASATTMQQAIADSGGVVVTELPSINGVVARVPASALSTLQATGLIVTNDGLVQTSGTPISTKPADDDDEPLLLYPSLVTGAGWLHLRDMKGAGVTVAIIDSGMPPIDKAKDWTQVATDTLKYEKNGWRMVYKDFVTTAPIDNSSDPYGHGTHVLATIADARVLYSIDDDDLNNDLNDDDDEKTVLNGIAPEANLVVVRALDGEGTSPYSRVIAAIEWVIAHKDEYNIRVLNLSLQAPIHGPYWHDPLNQAVMAAWDAGITVVVAAGNYGPDPATITVPGNVPYVITVGALKPGYYTENGVDELARYSSAGPTESKFVKPDVVIAGSRVLAAMPADSVLAPNAGLAREKAKLQWNKLKSKADLNYYYLSGTSMSAAEVSGGVALLLQDEPNLTNDQIKYRLTATAQLAMNGDEPAYSIWQQGAGRVDLVGAVDGTTTESANSGMDITTDRDPSSDQHYLGTTEFDGTQFYLADINGQAVDTSSYGTWAGSYGTWAGSYGTWAGSYGTWAGSYGTWAGSYGTWAGSYGTWAGSYSTWAGSLNGDPSAASYQLSVIEPRCELCTYVPLIMR